MALQHVTTKAEIDKITASSAKIVVVDFYADWCGPCKQIAPLYQAMSEKYASKAVFLKVDTEKMSDTDKKAFEVRALPTFKILHKLKTLDTIVGADGTKLEAAVALHSAKHGAFGGGGKGHSLTGPRTAIATPAAAVAPAASGRPAGASSGRRNPWADPNWVPPGMRGSSATATATASGSAAASASKPAAQASSSSQPAAQKKGKKTEQPSSTAAAQPAAQAPRAPAVQQGSAVVADANLLSALVGMGFPTKHSEQALIATKNRNADVAVTWMLDHPAADAELAPVQPNNAPAPMEDAVPADAPDPSPAADSSSAAPVEEDSKMLDIAAAAAAQLGGAVVDDSGGPSIGDSEAEMDESMREIVEAKRKEEAKHAKMALKGEPMPEILTRKVAELTSDEKQEWLAAKKELVRKQKAVAAIENTKQKERSRVENGKAALELQRKREEYQRQAAIEARKKAERDKKKQKNELKEKIRAEKAARAKAREQERQDIERMRAAKAAAAAKK